MKEYNSTRKIALIGAGIANLTLVNLLKKTSGLNLKICMFERSRTIGGRVATRKKDDLYYDNGANYFDITDKRIENLILENNENNHLYKIDKPIYIFDENNSISTNMENIDKRFEKVYIHFNSNTPKYTYSIGIKNLAEFLLYSPNSSKLNFDIKFSKNISKIIPVLKNENQSNDSCDYSWNLISEELEDLGIFDKIIFGAPSLNIAKIFEQSNFNMNNYLDLTEKTFFENATKEFNVCKYKKCYSLALAYNLNEIPDTIKNTFFGMVNGDGKHFISTIFVENHKNRKSLNDNNTLILIVQFPESESIKNLNVENDKEKIYNIAMENLEKLIPELRTKQIKFFDLKRWGYSFPNSKLNFKFLDMLSKRNIEIVGDSVSGIGKIDKAMLTSFKIYEKVAKY